MSRRPGGDGARPGAAAVAAPDAAALAERRRERTIGAYFAVAALAGIGLAVTYALGGQTQIEGTLLGICFVTLGIGIVKWSALLGAHDVTEDRHELSSGAGELEALESAFTDELGPSIRRRSFLLRMLGVAGAALAAALVFPVDSLGPPSGDTLKTTGWRKGLRLVTTEGAKVGYGQLQVDGVLTVFPEGSPGESDAQALLIRVPTDLLKLPPDRLAVAPGGHVAYSKICSHAGCPVGLYRASIHALFCPCHQSQFDVLRGARPIFGPAARPLPQLPLGVDAEGYLIALGDFFEPVGPAFWNRSKK